MIYIYIVYCIIISFTNPFAKPFAKAFAKPFAKPFIRQAFHSQSLTRWRAMVLAKVVLAKGSS